MVPATAGGAGPMAWCSAISTEWSPRPSAGEGDLNSGEGRL